MKKATDDIAKKIQSVDFVIEVLDARAITTTSNNELLTLLKNKPLIKIALKSDFSDQIKSYDNVLIGNIKQSFFREQIIKYLNHIFASKIEKMKQKGLVNYQLIGMVVGIPNIGKSSLINFLAKNKTLITENRAGVTKRQTIKKINQNFYLIDTPGVLFKKIENLEEGYQLSILNNIAKKVLPLFDVIRYHYYFLKTHYISELNSYFNEKFEAIEFEDFINFIAQKYQFKIKNNEIDLERTLNFLFTCFSEAKICKFHYN